MRGLLDGLGGPSYVSESECAGTQNVLDAAVRAGSVERFLHVSTTDVYGYPRVPCDESAPMRNVGLPYNRTKIQGENEVWRAHREQGLPVTVVRPATIYGPRGKDFVVEIANMLRQGMMLLIDGGRARGGFTYVDNVAQAMMQAAESPATVGRALQHQRWYGHYVARLHVCAGGCAWLSAAMVIASLHGGDGGGGNDGDAVRVTGLAGRPLLTRHAVYLLARDQEYPAARAREDFGFAPRVSFAEGMARSAEWLRSKKPA